jgi:LAS superfamily LD-carboxypeptidase LdcB
MIRKEVYSYLPLLAFAILLGGGIYSYVRIHVLSNQLDTLSHKLAILETSVASSTVELKQSITLTNSSLAAAINQQTLNVGAIESRLEQKVGNVAGTVTTLEKLSKTDPQLLAKYSKVFFLNENYAPARLTEIPETYKYSSGKAVSIHSDVWPHLQALLDGVKRDGINLFVSSGYRSFAEQKALKGDYKVTYGAGTANQFSADQGYSEHQLGTALDFITTGLGGELDGFDLTPAYQWLLANAYRYGFILSYPKNNGYYVFEPWHWRFVGVKLATDLHAQGKNFYDLDQRKIDEYLVYIFE